MTAEGAFTPDSDIDRIFGPVVHRQTYRNLLYLAISFPLAMVYFVLMSAGLSLGFATLIVVVGVFVLAFTLSLARGLARFEREMAKSLLGAVFEPRQPIPRHWRATLTSRRSWSAALYLLLRLPLAIAGFVAAVLFCASIAGMAAPLIYLLIPYAIEGERIAGSEEALLVSLFGFVFFLVCAHLVNAIAAVCRKLSVAML